MSRIYYLSDYLRELNKYKLDIETDINFSDIRKEYYDTISEINQEIDSGEIEAERKKKYEENIQKEALSYTKSAKKELEEVKNLKDKAMQARNGAKNSKDPETITNKLEEIDSSNFSSKSAETIGYIQKIENKLRDIEEAILDIDKLDNERYLQEYKNDINNFKASCQILLSETIFFGKETQIINLSQNPNQNNNNKISQLQQDLKNLYNKPFNFQYKSVIYAITLGNILNIFDENQQYNIPDYDIEIKNFISELRNGTVYQSKNINFELLPESENMINKTSYFVKDLKDLKNYGIEPKNFVYFLYQLLENSPSSEEELKK